MFLELVGEDLEDAVDSIHLEFVAEVKQVPVEEVAEGGEGLVFGHVQDEDSADEAHTLDISHIAFDHSGCLEDFSKFVLKIGVLTNRINPDMSPGYILINQLQLLTQTLIPQPPSKPLTHNRIQLMVILSKIGQHFMPDDPPELSRYPSDHGLLQFP